MSWDGTWQAIGSYSIGGIGAVVEEIAEVLTNVGATNNGVWFDNKGCIALNLEVSGITTATVKLVGSNATTIPPNTNHGKDVASITADGIKGYEEKELSYWNKVFVSAWTSGTITVRVKRIRRSG